MSLDIYNNDVHHVGIALGSAPSTFYGFEIIGSYSKELQREALAGQDFGGASDLLGHSQSLSRVTQDDFTGGAYSRDFIKDAAMFGDCDAFVSQQQAKGLVSVPPMILKKAYNPAGATGYSDYSNVEPVAMFMVAGSIYVCFNHGILRHQIDADTNTFAVLYNDPGSLSPASLMPKAKLVDAAYDANDQVILCLYEPTSGSDKPYIARVKTDLTLPLENKAWDGPVGSEGLTARGFEIRDTGLVCSFGTHVWNGVPPKATDLTQDEVRWTEVGRLPGRWRDSVAYSGFTYILTTDGAYKTQISAFDGTSILPITNFPFNFEGKCVSEYAGRIYVGGVGTDVNGSQWYAELYEVTGASTRLVRTFSPEANRSDGNWPHTIRSLSVFEGLLWFSQGKTRMMAYDITSDGLFGASAIPSSVASDFELFKVAVGRGRHWYWGSSSTTGNRGIYRVAQPADTVSSYSAKLTTSEFAWEPGIRKRWSEMRVHSRYVASTLEYSQDGGSTWTTVTVGSTEQQGVEYFTTFSLAAIAPSTSIRFRISLACGTNVTTFKELVAYTFTFVALETGKVGWSFTAIVAEHIEGLDGSDDGGDLDLSGYSTWLWTAATSRLPLVFKDVDGTSYNVQLQALRQVRPIISPSRGESHFAISLIEV